MLFDPNHLATLSAILRLGSFDAAAADLAVTPSAISQRIKALEDHVGTSLIHRGPPCTGTAAGLRIAKHAEDIGLLEAQLSRELALENGSGSARVKVAVPADSLATWFVTAMAAVPDLLFDLVIDDQDHSADWLRRGEVSAAVTVGGQPVTGCDAVPLGTLRYLATCNPAFARQWFREGVTVDTLSIAPCMTFNRKDNLQKTWLAKNFDARISPPSHFLPSTHAFVDAACAGLGWGMNPESLVRQAIKDNRLQVLLPDTPLDVPLTWQVGRIMATALAPLTKAVKSASAKDLIRA